MAKVKLEYAPKLCKLINPDDNIPVKKCNIKQCTEIISPDHSWINCEHADVSDKALLIKEAKTVSYISNNNNNWTLIIDDICINSSDVIIIDKLTIDDEVIIDN